jgi:hypothetical protein
MHRKVPHRFGPAARLSFRHALCLCAMCKVCAPLLTPHFASLCSGLCVCVCVAHLRVPYTPRPYHVPLPCTVRVFVMRVIACTFRRRCVPVGCVPLCFQYVVCVWSGVVSSCVCVRSGCGIWCVCVVCVSICTRPHSPLPTRVSYSQWCAPNPLPSPHLKVYLCVTTNPLLCGPRIPPKRARTLV